MLDYKNEFARRTVVERKEMNREVENFSERVRKLFSDLHRKLKYGLESGKLTEQVANKTVKQASDFLSENTPRSLGDLWRIASTLHFAVGSFKEKFNFELIKLP